MAKKQIPPESPKDHEVRFITRLREWCEPYGRQAMLARALGVPPQRLTEWLNGAWLPDCGVTLAMAKIIQYDQTITDNCDKLTNSAEVAPAPVKATRTPRKKKSDG